MLPKYLKDEKYSVIITMGKLLFMHLAKITTWAVELNFNLKDFWYEHGAIGLTSFCFFFKSYKSIKKNDKSVYLMFSKIGIKYPSPSEYKSGLLRA